MSQIQEKHTKAMDLLQAALTAKCRGDLEQASQHPNLLDKFSRMSKPPPY